MLTQNSHLQTSRISRIMAFPLLALLLGIFTTAPAQPADTVPAKDKAKILQQFNRNLRYPEKALAASQEGAVSFAIRLGEGGQLLDYTPLDTPPEGKDVLKIVVTSFDSKTSASMTPEEAHTLFQEETRRASANVNASKVRDVAPGEYYLRISFRLEHQTGK